MHPHLNPTGNVFHDGERQMHARLGVGARMQELGLRVIRDHMPDQHRTFFEMLRIVHLGMVDENGHPWAVTRIGDRGFMLSQDKRSLTIASRPLAGEPAGLDTRPGAKISVLGLEMETRRRNRLNATIRASGGDALQLSVDQSYGNCPKYIQTRVALDDAAPALPQVTVTPALTDRDRALIRKADILMLASRAPELGDDPRAGVDINHRGGMPGFVEVPDAETLIFPDYRGNNFYNSLGNILLDARVGLQFFDFETGTTLNITGMAEVVETPPTEPAAQLPLMGRSVRVRIGRVTRASGALPLRYALAEYSPNNPALSV